MKVFRLIFDDDLQDEVFDSYEAAEETAYDLLGCCAEGAEVLELSDPFDDDYEEFDHDGHTWEIVEEDE